MTYATDVNVVDDHDNVIYSLPGGAARLAVLKGIARKAEIAAGEVKSIVIVRPRSDTRRRE